MRFFIAVHGLLGAAFTVTLWLVTGRVPALAFASGAALTWLNAILLVSTWPRIFRKKQVALSIGVIVFKFAILGWIIYEVVSRQLFPLGWFTTGMALILISTVMAAFRFAQQNPEKAENQ